MKLRKTYLGYMIIIVVLFHAVYGKTDQKQNDTATRPLFVRELPEFRISKGEILYIRYCSFCHGESGEGDGLNAFRIPVKPFNFTNQEAMAQISDKELEKVILFGGTIQGLSSYMPAFGKTLSTHQVKHLVNFIRSKSNKY